MSQTGSAGQGERSISRSLREYGRGIAGGLLFSLPLLYTMEVWWAGFIARPLRLLAYGQIDSAVPACEVVGKVVVEAVTVAIGVSVGSSQLGSV